MTDYSEIEKAFTLWKKGLSIAEKPPEGWFSSNEMAKAKGVHRNTANRILKKLKDAGLVETKTFSIDTGGFIRSIPHYRTCKPKKTA